MSGFKGHPDCVLTILQSLAEQREVVVRTYQFNALKGTVVISQLRSQSAAMDVLKPDRRNIQLLNCV